jgi:LPS export ABC transporter protein LptC
MSFKYILGVAIILGLVACESKEAQEPQEYTGPLREVEDMEMYHVDNEHIKVIMHAKIVHELANGDRNFPEGIDIKFFDEDGELETTLRANTAYFFKEKNLWQGQGNVEIVNIKADEQLNTEELFWNQVTKKINTEKFVTLRTQGTIIYGEGLTANQDLSDYEIPKVSGTLELEE